MLRDLHSSDIKLSINILPIDKYNFIISKLTGSPPKKIEGREFTEDYNDIEKTIRKIWPFTKENDIITVSAVCAWAERQELTDPKLIKGLNACPQIEKVSTEAFIAPDGTWYACCLDSKCELQLGNVMESSLEEIDAGEKRGNLLKNLKKKKFKEIGGPCATVICCHAFEIKK